MKKSLACAFALGITLSVGGAFAQQPQPQPHPPAPAQPGQPGQPGQPVPPGGAQLRPVPRGQLPPALQQHIRELQQQQQQRGGVPLPPPGQRGRPPAFHAPEHAAHAEEGGAAHGGGHHCPGHGPMDRPPHINWWQGLLAVNNELAQSDNPLYRLLFRYENEKNPCDPKNQPPPLLASILNVLLLGFILYRFGRKPLADALLKRKERIMGEITLASKLKKDAEKRLRDYEDRLENLEETREELRAEFAAQAELEKQHVLAEAEERRARMKRDAEFRIEQELKAARAELLREAVEEATLAAEELIKKRVNASDMDRLASDYLSSIGSAMSGASATSAAPQGGR